VISMLAARKAFVGEIQERRAKFSAGVNSGLRRVDRLFEWRFSRAFSWRSAALSVASIFSSERRPTGLPP
jgi:hypothetical protein